MPKHAQAVQRDLRNVKGPAINLEQLADALYLTASQAWQKGSGQGERIQLGTEAVIETLRSQPMQTLKALKEHFQELLSGGIKSAMQYGSIACGGPNTALDVPNAVLEGIKRIEQENRPKSGRH